MRLIDADDLIVMGLDAPDDEHQLRFVPYEFIEEAETIDAVKVVRCSDCIWFDKEPGNTYGYCHAAKHAFYSNRWEIGIYRKCEGNFYCADGERQGDDDETD